MKKIKYSNISSKLYDESLSFCNLYTPKHRKSKEMQLAIEINIDLVSYAYSLS